LPFLFLYLRVQKQKRECINFDIRKGKEEEYENRYSDCTGSDNAPN